MTKITRIYNNTPINLYEYDGSDGDVWKFIGKLEVCNVDTTFFFDLNGRDIFVVNKINGKNIALLTHSGQWHKDFSKLLFIQMVEDLEAIKRLGDICD